MKIIILCIFVIRTDLTCLVQAPISTFWKYKIILELQILLWYHSYTWAIILIQFQPHVVVLKNKIMDIYTYRTLVPYSIKHIGLHTELCVHNKSVVTYKVKLTQRGYRIHSVCSNTVELFFFVFFLQ